MLETSFFESHLLPGKKIQVHEGERVQDNNNIISQFKKKKKKTDDTLRTFLILVLGVQ